MKNNADDNKLKAISKNMEFGVTKSIEDHLIRCEREHKKKLDAFIAERYLYTQINSNVLNGIFSHKTFQW